MINRYKRFLIFLLVVILSFVLVVYAAPAFRGEREIPSAIIVGSVHVRIYSLLIVSAFLVSFFVARKQADLFGIHKEDLESLVLPLVILGLVGARLHTVLLSPELRSSMTEALSIWKGGLGIFGAIAGGAVAVFFWAKRKRVSYLRVFDLLALVLPLGQAVGRWGNFFNQEAFGYPTSLPWKMYVPLSFRPTEFMEAEFFHPAFLYESIWDLLVFGFLFLRRKNFSPTGGRTLGTFLVLYGVGRFFIEQLRVDSLFVYSIRVDQVFAAGFVLMGLLIFFRNSSKQPAVSLP